MSNSNKLNKLIEKINDKATNQNAYVGLLEKNYKYFWTILKYKDNKISITYYNESKKTEDLNKETRTLDEYFKKFINSPNYLSNIHVPNLDNIGENEKTL